VRDGHTKGRIVCVTFNVEIFVICGLKAFFLQCTIYCEKPHQISMENVAIR
jgi:hypothetical protein